MDLMNLNSKEEVHQNTMGVWKNIYWKINLCLKISL
jgi:hypothetical protein